MNDHGFPQALHAELAKYQKRVLLVGAAGVCALAALGFRYGQTVLPAYLVGFLFWAGISIASLMLVMLHYLVGGQWGYPIKRMLEASALVVIPMAVLFVPLLFGATSMYEWTKPTHDLTMLHKQKYLNLPFWTARAGLYFAIWSVLALIMDRTARKQDATTNPAPSYWVQNICGPGIVISFIAASFASIDWGMSLEPLWYSAIYGPLLIVGWGLSTFSLMVVFLNLLTRHEPMASAVTKSRIHDIGNLMLALTMIWAYMSFMQFLIQWSGNLTEEIPWYLKRIHGGWQFVAVLIIVFQFFMPFFILLFREVKRGVGSLSVVAVLILVMQVVALTWIIVPAFNSIEKPAFSFLTVLLVPVAFVAIGAIWLTAFLSLVQRKPILPQHDPGIPLDAATVGAH